MDINYISRLSFSDPAYPVILKFNEISSSLPLPADPNVNVVSSKSSLISVIYIFLKKSNFRELVG